MTFLASHFERIQRRLMSEGDAAKSFGHGLNRGMIREAFIREFLAQNISDIWGIGTGEVIHKGSAAEEVRNQIDIVVHNKRFPKLSFATGIDLFFIESVSSFIEIKSDLKKEDLRKTAATAKKIKSQADFAPRRFYLPEYSRSEVRKPRPYSFVFSYDGPKKIETVRRWMMDIAKENDYRIQGLQETPPDERKFFDHHFIDGVFILGRGFVLVDAFPIESQIARAIRLGHKVSPNTVWTWSDGQELIVLWALLNEINQLLVSTEYDLLPYIGDINFILEGEEVS